MKKYILTLFSLFCASFLQARSTDLSADGTANCYIVPAGAGQYSFNALVKGNGVEVCGMSSAISASSIKGVKLLWQDAPVVNAATVSYSDGRIGFKTMPKAVTGNAVIAIFSDKSCSEGRCIWSWHIWMTDAGDEEMGGVTFMDRNLGADGTGLQESGRNGLFYQWGRKDPFPQTGRFSGPVAYGKQTVEFAAAHPGTFLTRDGRWCEGESFDHWCKGSGQEDCMTVRVTPGTKTMFDPCPVGYHVPNICDIIVVKTSGKHTFVKAGARWYDLQPDTPDKAGKFGYYWCATIDRHYQSRGSDFYIWDVGVGIALGSHYYTCSAYTVRPQKF